MFLRESSRRYEAQRDSVGEYSNLSKNANQSNNQVLSQQHQNHSQSPNLVQQHPKRIVGKKAQTQYKFDNLFELKDLYQEIQRKQKENLKVNAKGLQSDSNK